MPDTPSAKLPRHIFQPDPVLGWSLTPDRVIQVPFRRDVVQTVASDGFRVVPSSAKAAPDGIRLNLYGCSYTYGTGLRDEETFAHRIQENHPDIRIRNRGVSGYGNVQTLLSFENDIKNGEVQAAIIFLHEIHRIRNLPHPARMRQYLSADWYRAGVEHVPCCNMVSGVFAGVRYVPIWQPCLQGRPIDAFIAPDYVFEQAMVQTCKAIAGLAEKHGIPAGFALISDFDAKLADQLAILPNLIDIAVRGAEFTFSPFDGHPNAKANALFAERLDNMVTDFKKQVVL